MTKIDIFSGFLGAGKTTLIKKLVAECFRGEQIVIIENEFGEIGIDGGFLQDAGIQVTEMNSGCICCSLVGDFSRALEQVVETYHPARIIIEPSGVGKLSDVAAAVMKDHDGEMEISGMVTVVDANKCKTYSKNFGEFYINQIESATTIVLSRTSDIAPEKLQTALGIISEHNTDATVITTPWDQLTGRQILDVIERTDTLTRSLEALKEELEHHHHHHHEDECNDPDCCCHHHHDEDDDEDEHEHHHHHHHHHEDECDDPDCDCHHHHDDDDDDDEDEHEHHHHHHHHEDECDDPDCCCHHHHDDDDDDEDEHEHHHHGEEHEHEHHHHHHDEDECDDPDCDCHHHHEHGHHHADEVFTSWGTETARVFTKEEISAALAGLDDTDACGTVLRAKGIVAGTEGWIYFDYVPGEPELRTGSPAITGRLCVIGSKLNEAAIRKLFGV